MAEVNKLYLKIGTKAQYTANKASLAEPAKTLALTPLAEEFSSNTDSDGVLKFAVSGTTVTVSKAQIAKKSTDGQNVGTTVNLDYVPYNSSTQSGYVPNFNWLAWWKGGYNTGGSSNLLYSSHGQIVGTGGASTTTVGSGVNPIYVTGGVATASSSTVGSAGSSTAAATPVYLNSGTITACSIKVPVDQSSTTNTAFPVYFANDTTAGSIEKINFSTRFEYNPNTRKFTVMSAANTTDTFTFGVQKVSSW